MCNENFVAGVFVTCMAIITIATVNSIGKITVAVEKRLRRK